MTPQLVALYAALAAFSAHDVWRRTIPPWLCALVALGVAGGVWQGVLTWWWTSAALAALVFLTAKLPLGDRAGVFLVAGLLPPDQAGITVVGAVLVGVGYVYVAGRYRSMIGFPFFPAVGICAIVVTRWLT